MTIFEVRSKIDLVIPGSINVIRRSSFKNIHYHCICSHINNKLNLLIIRMKQTCLVVIFVWLSLDASLAQPFRGGVAAGLVGSQVAGDTYSGFHKPGAYASVWVSLAAGEHSSFQTEISYFQKGSRHNPDEKRQDYTLYLMRLGYIEMPFLYRYQLKNKLSLEAGPSFSYLLHSYEELDYQQVSYGAFSVFNPSFTAGVSYPITEKISAHFRMNSSLLSIRKYELSGAVYRLFDHGQYNDCILFFLSYRL